MEGAGDRARGRQLELGSLSAAKMPMSLWSQGLSASLPVVAGAAAIANAATSRGPFSVPVCMVVVWVARFSELEHGKCTLHSPEAVGEGVQIDQGSPSLS